MTNTTRYQKKYRLAIDVTFHDEITLTEARNLVNDILVAAYLRDLFPKEILKIGDVVGIEAVEKKIIREYLHDRG